MSRISQTLVSVLTALLIGCGGGGGGGSSDSTPAPTPDPTPVEDDPISINLMDSVPANGININPLDTALNLSHLGQSDMTFSYAGECNPTATAIRRGLFDLANQDVDQVIDHRIVCPDLADSSSYTIDISATRDNDAVFETALNFGTTNAIAPSLTVQQSIITPADTVNDMFTGYVEGALFDELDLPGLIEDLVAEIVLEISEANWSHMVDPDSIYDVVSHKVVYQSRAPDGSPSNELTGLVTFPDTFGVTPFNRRDRVIVLTHATGSTPSELNPGDAWYILANQFASRGYLVVAPDNWGRGGTDAQPETYLMASRTAYNGLDLLKAALASEDYREYFSADGPIDITIIGYSQGGHSAIGLWQLIETSDTNLNVQEVYSGGAPHNLYQTFRGVLQHLDNSCNGGAYCRFVDEDTTVPFATDRIIPGIITYTNTGLTSSDLIDGDDLTDGLVEGFLGNDPTYDAFKVMLQVNGFTNIADLGATIEVPPTLVHLYHSRFDRLVPVENTEELAEALLPEFNIDFHENRCNSNGYELIFNTTSKVGALHTICGLSVLDDAMEDLK